MLNFVYFGIFLEVCQAYFSELKTVLIRFIAITLRCNIFLIGLIMIIGNLCRPILFGVQQSCSCALVTCSSLLTDKKSRNVALSISVSSRLSVYLSAGWSDCLHVWLCLSACLSACMSVCLSTDRLTYTSVCMFMFWHLCVSVCVMYHSCFQIVVYTDSCIYWKLYLLTFVFTDTGFKLCV